MQCVRPLLEPMLASTRIDDAMSARMFHRCQRTAWSEQLRGLRMSKGLAQPFRACHQWRSRWRVRRLLRSRMSPVVADPTFANGAEKFHVTPHLSHGELQPKYTTGGRVGARDLLRAARDGIPLTR